MPNNNINNNLIDYVRSPSNFRSNINSTEEINNITLETKNFLMYSNINNPNNNISQIFS